MTGPEFGPWGPDADLAFEQVEVAPLRPSSPLGWAVRGVVSLHQMVFSEADGPRSHFRPSSSQYMVLAVQKYGVTQGVLMGLDRLMRENSEPWIYPRIVMSPDCWLKWDPP
jgi:putative component of membrane protein insertase Oxa1/YidC/SpoIIIJ protein YidD